MSFDAVEHPEHYASGSVECIDAMKAASECEGASALGPFVGYLWFNLFKYVWRWPSKNGLQDLKKARWYLDRLIGEVSNEGLQKTCEGDSGLPKTWRSVPGPYASVFGRGGFHEGGE